MASNSLRVYWRSTGSSHTYVTQMVGGNNNYTCTASPGESSCDVENIQCGDVYNVVVAPLTPEGGRVTFCPQRLYSGETRRWIAMETFVFFKRLVSTHWPFVPYNETTSMRQSYKVRVMFLWKVNKGSKIFYVMGIWAYNIETLMNNLEHDEFGYRVHILGIWLYILDSNSLLFQLPQLPAQAATLAQVSMMHILREINRLID